MLGQVGLACKREPRAFRFDAAVVRPLAVALVAAATGELVLLRLATRIGVHLPKSGVVRDVLHGVSFSGAFALNLASILATGLVVLVLASIVWRAWSPVLRWSVGGVSAALLWGLGLELAGGSGAADAVFGIAATLLAVLVGVVFVSDEVSRRGRAALGLIVAAYVAYQYYALGHLLYRSLGYAETLPAAITVLRFGELLVVLASVAVFWAWGAGRWRRARLAGTTFAVVPVLVVLMGSLAPAATTSILALWTTGLSLYLPLPIYLLALGLYLLTIAACWRSGDGFWTSTGLLLLLFAGYMPEATYDHLLLLLGVALLAGGGAGLAVHEPVRASRASEKANV